MASFSFSSECDDELDLDLLKLSLDEVDADVKFKQESLHKLLSQQSTGGAAASTPEKARLTMVGRQ